MTSELFLCIHIVSTKNWGLNLNALVHSFYLKNVSKETNKNIDIFPLQEGYTLYYISITYIEKVKKIEENNSSSLIVRNSKIPGIEKNVHF